MAKDKIATMSDADQLLKLDNQLCFRLYAASRMITQLYRPALDELGITYPQYLILLAMWEWDDEGVLKSKTLQMLTKRLYLDSGTMTPLFRRMETAGLVGRVTNPDDRRAALIQLTQKGRRLKKRAKAIPETLICRFANDETEIKQYELLKKQLDILLNGLDQSHQAIPSSP